MYPISILRSEANENGLANRKLCDLLILIVCVFRWFQAEALKVQEAQRKKKAHALVPYMHLLDVKLGNSLMSYVQFVI